MRFQLLGPIAAWRNDTPVPLRGSKIRTVLATLLVSHNRVVPDSTFVEMLWGEAPPRTAQAQIQTYASRLRGLLGSGAVIERQRPGYRLRVAPEDVDLVRFETLAERGRTALAEHRPGQARDVLRDALAMWRGRPLADVTEFLAATEQPRLEETRLAVLEDRIDADLALGRYVDLVAELTALVSAHPTREGPRARLMLALYQSGRKADALAAYHEVRLVLAEDLGIDPSAALRDLRQAILTDVASPTWFDQAGRVRRRSGTHLASLPPEPADFIGRPAAALRAYAALDPATGDRDRPALCSIVGMGGVGKSTLALHLARRLRETYPHGQFRIDLRGTTARPVAPARALADAVAMLGLTSEPAVPGSVPDLVRRYRDGLSGRRILLILDDAAAEQQVRPLLPAAPGCAVLVTSRNKLTALEGAHRIELGGFEPAEAAELLARIVGPARAAAEPDAVARIADLCDHLPLGIRISGARLAARTHWPLARLADRLSDSNRVLDELRVADLEVRASLARSYRMLRAPARRALRLLSMLDASPFSVWTVAVVLDVALVDARELVEELVDAYMLKVSGTGEERYRFHRLLRAMAYERVRAEETARDRGAALGRLAAATRGWLLADAAGAP